ncbi:MAG: hypothetical protein GY774_30025, partial [Planctomycetes bacterium]|nr:hypothetical protein [Planctomycetota bacterium]
MVSLFVAVILWFSPDVHADINAQRRTSPEALKSNPDAKKNFRLSPRFDRFFPLADSFGYSGSGSFDMIIWLPRTSDRKTSGLKLRLWMKTDAIQPEIEFSGTKRHRPVGTSPKDSNWKDFGIVDRAGEEFGNGFACMRVFGLKATDAKTSYVVVTPQTDVSLSGSIRDAERALCGIARDEVGRTLITPSRVPIKTSTEFTLCYEAGPQGLPAGSLLRLAFAKAFSMPQNQNREAAGWIEICEVKSPVEFIATRVSIESHERNDAFFHLPKGLTSNERIYFRYTTDFTY